MEKQTEITLILHITNYTDALKKWLLANLKEKLNLKKNEKITLVHAEKYWKIPQHTRCTFELILNGNDNKLIKELPNNLDVKKFLLIGGDDVLVWDKKTDGGIFLHENVEWVHAYSDPIN
jgi:hypothetical protein